MEVLHLHRNLNDEGLRHISSLTNLMDLKIGYCSIGNEGLKHLSNLINMQYLDLEGCNLIENVGLKYLSKMTKLKHIVLGFCTSLDREKVTRLFSPSRFQDLTFNLYHYCE